jgi:RHS repeat-associated protein
VTYNYDATTHLLTSVVDSAAPGSQTWSYSYDAVDRLTSVTTPYGTVTAGLNDKINRRETLQAGSQGLITYGYDNDDDRVSILQNGATASLTYDALDRLSQQSLPATPNPVTTAWSFDAGGFLSSVTSTRNGTTLDSHSYTRDAVGNITQEVISGQGSSTSSFGYDDLYRLTSANVAGTAYSWAYDAVGNRTSQTVGGTTTTYTVDAADHLTGVNGSAVTSDANGSVTQDETGGLYTWDVRGRLVGLTKGGSSDAFQYGPDGLRLNKSVGGVLTSYLLDGGQVVTDTIGGTAYQTLYGPGTDHALARNGEFFLPNSLGSTTALTSSGGSVSQSYLYGPFGNLLNSPTDSNPFQFTGRENDGSGLLYYRARYYNPVWGRFVSADPLSIGATGNMALRAGGEAAGASGRWGAAVPRRGLAADLAAGIPLSPRGAEETPLRGGQPQGRAWASNPYAYAGDNPVNATDPSGRMTFWQWVRHIGEALARIYQQEPPTPPVGQRPEIPPEHIGSPPPGWTPGFTPPEGTTLTPPSSDDDDAINDHDSADADHRPDHGHHDAPDEPIPPSL